MRRLTDDELLSITGGAFSASMLGYIVRGIDSFMDIGRSLGSALRRMKEDNLCPLK